MIKRRTTNIIEEYDSDGKLIKKITTETTEDDDSLPSYHPYIPPTWNQDWTCRPNWWEGTMISADAEKPA